MQTANDRGVPMSYSELEKGNADETDIRRYLADEKQVAVTFRADHVSGANHPRYLE